MTKKIVVILIALGMCALLATVSGCNTIAGVGKDVERGGKAVHDAAKDVQRKI